MNEIELVLESNESSIVHLQLPVAESSRRYRIQIRFSPEPPDDWPDGFIERTAGKWMGDFPDRDEDFRKYYEQKRRDE